MNHPLCTRLATMGVHMHDNMRDIPADCRLGFIARVGASDNDMKSLVGDIVSAYVSMGMPLDAVHAHFYVTGHNVYLRLYNAYD